MIGDNHFQINLLVFPVGSGISAGTKIEWYLANTRSSKEYNYDYQFAL